MGALWALVVVEYKVEKRPALRLRHMAFQYGHAWFPVQHSTFEWETRHEHAIGRRQHNSTAGTR